MQRHSTIADGLMILLWQQAAESQLFPTDPPGHFFRRNSISVPCKSFFHSIHLNSSFFTIATSVSNLTNLSIISWTSSESSWLFMVSEISTTLSSCGLQSVDPQAVSDTIWKSWASPLEPPHGRESWGWSSLGR